MRKKIIKKIVAGSLILSMILTIGNTTYAAEKPVKTDNHVTNQKTTEEMESIIDNVESQNIVTCDEQGCIIDKEELKDVCDDIDINTVQKYYNEHGLGSISKENIYNGIINSVENVNDQITDGELEVLDKGTIVDASDDSYYLQGGSTYDVSHWWGKTRYKSTYDAKKWAHELNSLAAYETGVGSIGAAIFGPSFVVLGGLSVGYAWKLAEDISYYNGLSKRGIKVDICYWFVYSISKQ